ncbi:bifunctional methylenetetrahydrofolate dehydrogenase/methenyltetrahydrofolate cyclohydrolase FolD [Liquorilactobacillus hordei]|uniref:Bifunctional protein FolD n=1 Tax=Liquorilactobacillus hordei DSM 19519 TaxID=1423759 RepID=A0A0R1MTC9_9LACO|nr:bifunctional methylenetetrahydrofolate dehydrogenase/methenyltetrahydrofolate cyclohydrolase FolD [Liquorilactobacillus hordei]KRL08325.1 methylenetetrahydrofolate dehydrogenase (NADP+) methenyltetrahydrofolate cyclohydrolase [Liquorilactobacillus hordei DSM 19519]QYH52542.1 bifunctional methylenetetrahydrofolate dehydrogenase/methenyltetrahydrofolate cyclohydrolase FolD [Liquorilactobacillus hordei DSM 19519]
MTEIIDGRALSHKIRQQLKQRTVLLRARGIIPALAVILVGSDNASQIYVRNKHRAAAEIGLATQDFKFPDTTTEEELLELITKLNVDPKVHGILVQLPLPPQINAAKITAAINPIKDVDGFHPLNVGQLFLNDPQSLPCTPHGIMRLLAEHQINVAGKHVVIVGRSNIVGRPMAALLLNADATVTITHSKTSNLRELTQQADILIVAIGRAEFIKKADVKPGVVVVDVGMNRNAAGKLVGDVDFTEVEPIATAITPVPGGVGPMTIAMLLEQTVRFAERKIGG